MILTRLTEAQAIGTTVGGKLVGIAAAGESPFAI